MSDFLELFIYSFIWPETFSIVFGYFIRTAKLTIVFRFEDLYKKPNEFLDDFR